MCQLPGNETLLHQWTSLEGSIRMSIMFAGVDRAIKNMDESVTSRSWTPSSRVTPMLPPRQRWAHMAGAAETLVTGVCVGVLPAPRSGNERSTRDLPSANPDCNAACNFDALGGTATVRTRYVCGTGPSRPRSAGMSALPGAFSRAWTQKVDARSALAAILRASSATGVLEFWERST